MSFSRMRIAVLALLLYLAYHADAQTEYHGKLVGSFGSTVHDVQGTVYAENDSTLRIIGFSYDGTAPDAFLWGGETGSPSSNGYIIPDETGSMVKLGHYSNVDITVTLPSGKSVSNLAWISVWCRQFAANFGQVIFPSPFVPPSHNNIGPLGFSPLVHRTSATAVVVLDPKRIRFENLQYDGTGPDAYFWVGEGGTPSYDKDYRIPDENGSLQKLSRYSGETVTVTLIDNITVSDIGHIGLWCVLFRQDFGHVDIPAIDVLNIPPLPLPPPPTMTASTTTITSTTPTQTTTGTRFSNCETLVEDELQVSWYIDGTDIVIRLSSTNEEGMYSAFGVSGSSTSTQMMGGDVVVTFIDDNGFAQAVDYYLDAQAQCSPQNGAGACPDLIASDSAYNDVTLVESSNENGVTHIVYRRPLAARDATYDKAISTTGPTYVIWARGLINADGRVAYHSQQRSPATSNLQINFGQASSTCPPLGDTAVTPSNSSVTTPSQEEEGWTIEGIVETENATFTVDMGLTGGQKGYNYITGSVGWGIAWFINGLLIPELTLTRGKTYTFLVSGGDDPTFSANYHPFYITDDPSGGYAQLSQAEQQDITIYSGPEEGRLCQWTITSGTANPDSYASFADYKATLTRDCQPGEPGELVWTVPMDAPDLLYYHCFTHRFLGWKIHLVDGDENMTPPTTDKVAYEYHGKLVGSFTSTIHSVQGTVYAEDDSTLRIIGFSYDGTAPDAFLWGGETGLPSTNGFIIPDENGSVVKLGFYSNVDITVTLPSGKTVSNLAWISVWCRQFAANFGQVIFPSAFVPPSPYHIGPLGFSPPVHGTSATGVVVLDPKRIRFENLHYDGFGPDAYFWVGPGGTPSYDRDYRIPDETGSLQRLGRYSGETVTVTLIDNITVSDIDHIGLWCVLFRQDFGHVDIPALDVLNIPPLPDSTKPTQTTTAPRFSNCETLVEDELQVSWYIDGTDIVIRLSSTNEVGMYSAFGVSGSSTSTQMMGGDVVVTFIDDNGVAQAVDYYLDAQAQCSPQNGAGSCPDVISSGSAYNDVTLVESSRENGVTHIIYRRPLAARDAKYDRAISTTEHTYVIWARGLINSDGRVAYHSTQRLPANSDLQINFGRASSTCPPLGDTVATPSQEEAGWTIEGIVETDDATFTVDMGLTGGQKGYDYITGSVGWGIAWFINGLLIPELTLTRGKTYTFLVSGGDDPTFSANYHPFYITDDPSGGYAQLSQAEQQSITIYAGPEEGPLCQWEITSDSGNPDSYSSFADFKATLTRDCRPGEPGKLVWTVPTDAPDLLYYHCFTHRFLGWKIHLVDVDENMTSPGGLSSHAGTIIAVVVSCFLVLALVLSLGLYRQIKQKPKSNYTVTLLSDLRKNEVPDKFSK